METQFAKKMGKVALTLVLSLVLFSLSSCAKKSESVNNTDSIEKGRNHDHLVMALPVDPDGLDPQRTAAASTFQITSNIYETLISVDESGNIIPSLADSWTVSDDGTEITFTLREGAKFSDGTVCDSQKVKVSFARLMDAQSPRGSYYSGIDKITCLDDKTITFHYSALDVSALQNFAYSWAAIVDASKGDNLRSKPLGTGAYKLSSWIAQQNIILVKNEYYPGEVGINKVEFVIMPDASSQISSFNNKDIDIMIITGDQLPALGDKSNYNLIEGTINGLQLMAMNLKNEALSDLRVRQAINYAVDKEALIEAVWWGYGKEIGSHYPVVLPEYVDHTGTYVYNIEKAKELLKEAGYENGLTLRLALPKSYQEYVNAGIVIADDLKKVGINCSVEIVEWSDWLENVYTGRKYDLTVVGHTGRLDPYALLKRYESSAGENYFNYSNNRVDEILHVYNTIASDSERLALVQEIQNILAHEVPALYIQDPIQLYITQTDVEGFKTYPIELYNMKAVKFK